MWLTGLLASACAVVAVPAAAAAPLAIYVNGNHFVNGDGDIVRLTGTGADSTEYACAFGYAYGNYDPVAEADAMAAWHSNATRIPLNQDCWLGIHGYPQPGSGMLSAAGYRDYIEQFVAEANHDGMYVVLDLHFSGPNGSSGQRQMPDADSIAFWESVASAFKDDPAVIFDAFNEPLSSTDSGAPSGVGLTAVSWPCWDAGGCPVADYDLTYQSAGGADYTAVGMQQLVDAIRSVGATQPIILGGLDFSGDLSQWLANEPTDPAVPAQLAASFHDYDPGVCQGTDCLTGLGTIQSVAAHVPVVTGEFGYLYGDNAICTGYDSTDFANEYMNWADQNGISYLAFAWITPTLSDGTTEGSCANVLSHPGEQFSAHLINSDGSPAIPLGVEVYNHLASVVNVTSPGPGVPAVALAPGAPSGVGAVAGDGSAIVSFTAPAANGAPITSYTVTAAPGGARATGTASPITVTGLANGTSYTFTVTATNAVGAGPSSAASNTVTPTAPTAGAGTGPSPSPSGAGTGPSGVPSGGGARTGPPPVVAVGSGGSLRGLSLGSPVLRFNLTEVAAPIGVIAIRSPAGGLSFARDSRRLQSGVTARGSTGRPIAMRLVFARGGLEIVLAHPSSAIALTIRPPALHATRRLRIRARFGKASTFTFRIQTLDASGGTSNLKLAIRVS